MRTIQQTIYTFTELNESAKKRAISAHRERNQEDNFFIEDANKTLKKFCEIFGVNIRNFDYMEPYRNNYSLSFEDSILNLSGVRLSTYIWNNYKRDIFKGKYYGKLTHTHKDGTKIEVSKLHPAGMRHVKKYSKCILEHSCVLTGVCYDESILQSIYDFLSKPGTHTTFEDLIENCFLSLCKDVESEYVARNTDEFISEEIEANEYEFLEDGEMI